MNISKLLGMGYMDEDRGDNLNAGGGDDDGKDVKSSLASGDDADAAAAKAAKEKADKEEADRKAADKSIPKARFDEAVAKERKAREDAEKRLKEFEDAARAEAEKKSATKFDEELDALEEQLDAAIADGNKDKVKDLRKQIRAKSDEKATAIAKVEAEYAAALATERTSYAAEVSALEVAHPELNPEDPSYDQELTNELLELKGAYEATGMGSTAALKKAAKYIFKVAPAEAKKELEKEESAEDKAARLAAEKEAAEKAAKAKEEAIRRGLETKGKQPPAAASGQATDKRDTVKATDVSKMSDKEFGKLTDDDKARLRGDML